MSDPATHPRVPQELSQPISENLQKLAALFPAAVKDGALDIEALREELGEFEEIRPGDEKYELNWVGKQAAKKEAFAPLLGKTLAFKPEESKDPNTTENLYIEGDNLEALKLLRQNYYGEVKMIYIDPPYNTGKDFVYTDKFKVSAEESEEEEGAVSAEGKRLIKNEKSSNRFHARWLDMMYPRLRLAKDLLREDGVIFISIDDNEISSSINLVREVFGSENFVGAFSVRSTPNARDYGHIGKMHDYVLFFCKNIETASTEHLIEEGRDFNYIDEISGFNVHPLYNSNVAFHSGNRPNLFYPFYLEPDTKLEGTEFLKISLSETPNSIKIYPPQSQREGVQFVWRWGKDKSTENLNKEIIGYRTQSGEYRIVQKMRNTTKVVRSMLVEKEFSTRRGTAQVEELFKRKIFSFPKPIDLLKTFLQVGLDSEKVCLDMFSGSATTAHAVMQLNAEDGGKRRHIMVQLPEVCDEKSEAAKAGYKSIAEIGRERIRRAGEQVKEDLRTKHGEWKKNLALAEKKGEAAPEESNPYVLDPDSLDIGFKAFRIEDTKINWIRKDLRGEEISFHGMGNQDALDFVPGFTDEDIVYEVMLRQSNIPLTQAITKPVPGANGKRTYLYGESYLISLEETVTKELIETLAALEPTPLKYFFRDSAFGKDIALKDETFRRLNAEIAKNHGDQGTAYTVEFI